MFTRELTQSGHVRRFTIREFSGDGWEVRVEEDSQLVRLSHYRDWHRVERAQKVLDEQVAELENRGWQAISCC
jgi:hypothetical protein